MTAKHLLDKGLGFIASKKLLAFGIASGALFGGAIDGDQWTTAMCVYVGGQAAVDVAERLLRARS
jgi:uncharacterized membrane protein